jgi:hypothetical protein
MKIEWEKDTPQAVRLLITEGANWPKAFHILGGGVANLESTMDLIAARMQNLYLLGVNDGMKIGTDAALKMIKDFGKGGAS